MFISNDRLRSIAEGIHRGDRELLKQEYEGLEGFAMYAMRTFPLDPTVKEDLFHDKLVDFIRICRSPRYGAVQNWSAFLGRMFANACLDHLRAIREQALDVPEQNTVASVDPGLPEILQEEEREKVTEYVLIALEQLDEEDVVVLFKVLLQGEKQKSVAAEKGWTPPRLHYRFRVALEKLKDRLGYLSDQYDPNTLADMVFRASVRYIREHELRIEIEP